jgi:hypothetical protein
VDDLLSSRAVDEKEKNQLKQAAQRRQDVQDYIRRQIVSFAFVTSEAPSPLHALVLEEMDLKHGM